MLCIAVVLAPNLSYGLIFAAIAVLGIYTAEGLLARRVFIRRLLLLSGGLAISSLLSYWLLARDQMANATANMYTTYLASFSQQGDW